MKAASNLIDDIIASSLKEMRILFLLKGCVLLFLYYGLGIVQIIYINEFFPNMLHIFMHVRISRKRPLKVVEVFRTNHAGQV